MAVEQFPDELNLVAGEAGDAYMAWAVLSTRLESLPDWVSSYFQKLLEQIDAFDPHDDEEIALTCGLEVPVIRSKKRKHLGQKSQYDYAEIFDWVSARQRTMDVSLDTAIWEYVEHSDVDPDAYETIKSAYHTVRRARLASMDQDRPHFTLTQFKSSVSTLTSKGSGSTIALPETLGSMSRSKSDDV